MHRLGLVPLHEPGLPAAALEEHLDLLVGDAGEDRGVRDFKTVQVQDGQHRPVGDGVQKLVGVPRGGQGTGLRLAVPHHACGDEAGVIHHGPKGVGQGIAQLASLVDGAGGLRCGVAGDAAGEGKLAEQPLHPRLVLADVGVYLAVGAVQIVLGHHRVAPVAGTADVDHVQVISHNGPV